MFYSHQLLARKAPLGQIWMAATMHAKMNRRKLDQLDIIKICEEILNPSVPMALRLSGILMGGVVIVYERKVKLLYDDVTRFLVEINEAWKVKAVGDSTVLPKGKAQAKFEAVTLPDNVDMEVEQPMHYSDASFPAARFQHMRLDDLDEFYVNIDLREEANVSHHHQAELANITLFDDFGSAVAETDLYNRFERFDIGGDDDTQMNFTPQEQPQVPGALVPSPPPRDEQPRAPVTCTRSSPLRQEPPQPREGGIMDHQMEEREEQQAKRQQPPKRKARKNLAQVIMDNEQLMIPGSIYQTWLRDSSNIVSKRGRTSKSFNPILSTKISNLMDLPPVALISGLEKFLAEIHYPAPLLELWRKCTQPKTDNTSPSGGTTPRAQQPRTLSPPVGFYHEDVPQFHPEEFQRVIGSHPLDISIEKLRANLENMDFQGVDDVASSDHFVTPGSPGWSSKSIPSSGSGHASIPFEPEILPARRSKRRQNSSSRTTLGSLDPVEEEFPPQQEARDSKMRRLSGNGPIPDFELLEETAPTQTPHPVPSDPSVDRVTQSIRMQLKLHFDTPGTAQSESLDQLAFGMNRKRAAQLFYQTCGRDGKPLRFIESHALQDFVWAPMLDIDPVSKFLATCDFIRVQQVAAYGDILISKGPRM